MTETVNACNAYAPDLALDIHNNAGGGDGAEVFYSIHGGTGKTLAVNILDEIVKIGQNSRGAKTRTGESGSDYYGFIRRTTPPAVIVECAFVDHKTDIQIIDTKAEQVAMGVAIAKGVLKTLGVAWKEPVDKWYRVQVGAFRDPKNAENLLKELKSKGYDGFIV
jgi:N-acetylmuramoyl-L-alanine amidase